ncbi:MAG: energy-coupling factor transporter transmembrane component T [Clostridiaceae bacterium]|nr:energy-coupling factor transporter transmembrane protein EcfT [Clostridiaceae bacterium]MDD5797081.1 energy-coupling factor transporter transmembrane component T [Clostridiaceae bacterium]MDY4547124.1 energy-coupling factor transporter transmembrane component T [Candidatus Choladocola sp.]
MKSISLYVDKDTYLTRMHPFTKLCYIFTAIVASLVAGKLWAFAAFIGISLVMLISGKIIRKVFPLIAFSFTILITIFLIHGLFNHENATLLFAAGPLKFYQEGMLYALRISLNVLNMLLAFAVFVLTTRPVELVEDLERIGFSPKIGYVVSSVFQIVPQMSGTMNTIMDAQRSRGLETEGSLLTRAKSFLPLISPVVMSSLINTRERAIALEIRGFEAGQKKTYLREDKMKNSDRIWCVILLLLIIVAIAIRILL